VQKAHPSWIDRVPWPNVRQYLIEHPDIVFDDFAGAYSTSFFIRWDYDPNHVIITTAAADGGGILINPIYEEHIRQLRNWTVGDVFRRKFPELSTLLDVELLASLETIEFPSRNYPWYTIDQAPLALEGPQDSVR